MKEEQKEPGELRFECTLPEPPEQVWRVLTEPDLLAAWLMPNDFRAELGARFTFRPEQGTKDAPVTCQVLSIDPPRLLRYSWQEQDASEPSLVTFQLERSASGGTRLRLVHSEYTQQSSVGQLLFMPLAGSQGPRMRSAA
jgi:uncharacterized protein YndB with AHSA1/START domain